MTNEYVCWTVTIPTESCGGIFSPWWNRTNALQRVQPSLFGGGKTFYLGDFRFTVSFVGKDFGVLFQGTRTANAICD